MKQIKVHLFAFSTLLLWGSGFSFTRMIGDQIGSYSLGFIRCFLAAVVLTAIGLMTGIRRPFRKKDHIWFFLAGITGFSVYSIFYNLGLETLDSATASIICATSPISTAIGIYIVYKERIRLIGWIMMVTAFAGVVILLTWGNGLHIAIGALWIFLCATIFAGYNIITRKISEMGYTAMETVTYAAIWSAIQMIFFAPSAVHDMLSASLSANLSALYLGIMTNAVAYYLWGNAISLAKPTSTATNYLFINPIVATAFGLIMLREVPGIGTLIGGLIIIASVVIFSRKGYEVTLND